MRGVGLSWSLGDRRGRPGTEKLCCALCLGVVDWHNCGNVLGALESGWGLVLDNLHSLL